MGHFLLIEFCWYLENKYLDILALIFQNSTYSCWSPWVHRHECGAGDPGHWHQSGRSAGTLCKGWKDWLVDYLTPLTSSAFIPTNDHNYSGCCVLQVCLVVLVLAKQFWSWSWSTMWPRLTVVTLCLLEWENEPVREMICTMRWLSPVLLTWRTPPQR